MSKVSLRVNGRNVAADVPSRLHLADFLREELHLTGTHLGCEHGVCGACTVLVDGAPARACITYAAMCGGASVVSIEGLAEDAAVVALRAAFSAEHGLQCGYCTPGMLVTARDIVRRLPDADDDRIRLELSGNLCRCTGYNGIVRAIRRVLDLRLNLAEAAPVALPITTPSPLAVSAPAAAPAAARDAVTAGERCLTQDVRLPVTADALWAALQDPHLVASCVPGAAITTIDGTRILGEMAVSLGPIQGRFAGHADVHYGARHGQIHGEGQDKISKTRLTAAATFAVHADGEASRLTLDVSYSLRGALAQFARGPVVQAFADEMTAMVAKNLAAKLRGEAVSSPPRLAGASFFARAIWRRLSKFFGKSA